MQFVCPICCFLFSIACQSLDNGDMTVLSMELSITGQNVELQTLVISCAETLCTAVVLMKCIDLGCKGFVKATAMILVSEIGDKTFFVAALMAMRHPRRVVLAGALGALGLMTVLSALFGWAAPNLISRRLTQNAATFLFFFFGLRLLWTGFTLEGGVSSELAEVEAELDGEGKKKDMKKSFETTQGISVKDSKEKRRALSQYLSPLFLETFTLTFLGEWGDRSQIATIGLAAQENVTGVALGGVLGHAICTSAAVLGGKHLATQISERAVAFCGGILFLIFGIHSLVSVDS